MFLSCYDKDSAIVFTIDFVLIDQQSVGKINLHLMDTVNAKKREGKVPFSSMSIIFEIVLNSDPPCY
jgi:hypothetical protein